MAIKQSDLVEIVAELCRFIMFTGLFLWLLTNGAAYGNDIIQSLSQLGTNAGGQGLTPGDIVNLVMQVYQNTLSHVNFLQPESIRRADYYRGDHPDRLCLGRSQHDFTFVCCVGCSLCGADISRFRRLPMD